MHLKAHQHGHLPFPVHRRQVDQSCRATAAGGGQEETCADTRSHKPWWEGKDHSRFSRGRQSLDTHRT